MLRQTEKVLRKGTAHVNLSLRRNLSVGDQLKAVLAAMLLFMGVGGAQAEITCNINEKHNCAPGQGCKPAKVTIFVRMDPQRGTYQGCSTLIT